MAAACSVAVALYPKRLGQSENFFSEMDVRLSLHGIRFDRYVLVIPGLDLRAQFPVYRRCAALLR